MASPTVSADGSEGSCMYIKPALCRRNTSKDLDPKNNQRLLSFIPRLKGNRVTDRPRSAETSSTRRGSHTKNISDNSEQSSLVAEDSESFECSFGYRDILNQGPGDRNSQCKVVMSPTTISRCISVLIRRLMLSQQPIKYPKKDQFDFETSHRKNVFASSSLPLTSADYAVFRKSLPESSEAENQHQTFPSTPTSLVNLFNPNNSLNIPDQNTLTRFFTKICIDSQMEYECAVISLIFLTRLVELGNGAFRLDEDTYRGAVLACMLVANKLWDDFAMLNADYCCIFRGLTLRRVNELELQLLRVLGGDLWVSPSEFARCHFAIQELVTQEEIKRVLGSAAGTQNRMGSERGARNSRKVPPRRLDREDLAVLTVPTCEIIETGVSVAEEEGPRTGNISSNGPGNGGAQTSSVSVERSLSCLSEVTHNSSKDVNPTYLKATHIQAGKSHCDSTVEFGCCLPLHFWSYKLRTRSVMPFPLSVPRYRKKSISDVGGTI
mmetsp:Transcript_22761/g.33248  ORF Transcript_22761/g.33248 Transcript_22761/m.33248 type:complete len:494 (+) Transcript_22761:90-1571(+)|eukprot:CAMPEP_0185021554 /NCGR_PEP_ID=MMETSP1103-20130426/4240_1 /TAXON_ID=36769 /ORGANISM="Paraphysomonas bandaiensis, Strain Caron Lab Isolate" /LENGTH=493 /DNA_ID=CAMNT_0027553141 /DNA_START=90 /DNA_END=1571 /DNA_ORIENTATION=-